VASDTRQKAGGLNMKIDDIKINSLRMLYEVIRAKVKYGLIWNVRTSWVFLRLAWKALRGQIHIVQSQDSYARGGFRYHDIVVSKIPMSSEHRYEDL
jgi:hypothetical protein